MSDYTKSLIPGFDLDALAAAEKDAMRDLVLLGGPRGAAEQQAILDNCESKLQALAKLLPAMQRDIDRPRGKLQGRYAVAVA